MIFSPFVDVMLWPTLDISVLLQRVKTKNFTLAFITADANGLPSWGSQIPIDQNHYKAILERIPDCKITISFGGANGKEISCIDSNSVEMLVKYYKSVIETYPMVSGLDFDIEGAAVSNSIANDKRSKALVIIQGMYPTMEISFTLPVMPSGLLQDSLDLLSNARDNRLKLDHINLMVMDYGVHCTDMSAAGIQAYESVSNQLHRISYSQPIALTPMIGVNDTQNEVFSLKDATILRNYVKKVGGKGIKMWSLNRDVKDDGPLYKSSKIQQEDYEFCTIFSS